LTSVPQRVQTSGVERARRHRRITAIFTFGLLALVAELAGRSLATRIDVGRHVHPGGYAHADYYPVLLMAIKLSAALVAARLAWRFARARRVLAAVGARTPRPRLELSPRLWLVSFGVTALCYLLQTDGERISAGRWPLLAPWLHTSALPVFAVLAVLVALLYTALVCWLQEVERTAAAITARAVRFGAVAPSVPRREPVGGAAPRSRFGLAFESRPPPAPA
jgi:hypothetical protein